jgi:hypothetical protein
MNSKTKTWRKNTNRTIHFENKIVCFNKKKSCCVQNSFITWRSHYITNAKTEVCIVLESHDSTYMYNSMQIDSRSNETVNIWILRLFCSILFSFKLATFNKKTYFLNSKYFLISLAEIYSSFRTLKENSQNVPVKYIM